MKSDLSVAKFKRLIRPLLLKIHNLNHLSSTGLLSFSYNAEPTLTISGSLNRLEQLKQNISTELYQNYIEIFQIFKNIITTILEYQDDTDRLKFSTMCCFKIGKSVVLSTKSTFFKLNQLKLFDPESIPPELKRYNELLEDIDAWFDMEELKGRYKIHVFIGYLIHLLVIHLNLILYLLLPILIHWSWEQYKKSGNVLLHSIYTTMFHEFWKFDKSYCSQEILELVIIQENFHNKVYWYFLETGYWRELIEMLGMNYNVLILNTLPNKMNSLVPYDKTHVYEIVTSTPQHPKLNSVLAYLLTKIIYDSRLSISNSSTLLESVEQINVALENLKSLARLWLSFKQDMIFNSLYEGNEEIFEGIEKIAAYLRRKVAKYQKESKLSRDYQNLPMELDDFIRVISILKTYFLDLDLDLNYRKSLSRVLIELQSSQISPNDDFDEFLSWLHPKNAQLADDCYFRYYE